MSVEQILVKQEFEQIVPREVERKFIPLFPNQLDVYRAEGTPIEQYYLSHPSELFSLRFRESLWDGELTCEATLKDVGVVSADGIDRIEVSAPVSTDLYNFYKTADTPVIHKLRAEPYPGVTIDFYEDGGIQLESENAESWQLFVKELGDNFVEITGDRASSNEWRAHINYRRSHEGVEALKPAADLDPNDIARDILTYRQPNSPLVVHVGGRSGSGKSTIVQQVQQQLESLGLSTHALSTDDYHRGNTWLVQYNNGKPWEHWDDPIVYDTTTMSRDLAVLQSGKPIRNRQINWTDVEPHCPGTIEPADVILIEGIYALSRDITNINDLSYEVTTPLATCVGRRLLRDMKERPEFADPVKSLQYMLREAEPTYREQLTNR